MGFESLYQFREVELLMDSTGPGTFTLTTEQPGSDLQPRAVVTVDTPTTSKRLPVNVPFVGTTRGQLPQLKLAPSSTSTIILYGARLYATLVGSGNWHWYGIPVRLTPEQWDADILRFRGTPDEWTAQPLPFKATSEDWHWADLPVDEI